MARSSDLNQCFTPAVILSRVSLSGPAHFSVLLSEPVKGWQSSSVREVDVKLFCLEIKLAGSASIGAWDPMSVFPTHVAELSVLH